MLKMVAKTMFKLENLVSSKHNVPISTDFAPKITDSPSIFLSGLNLPGDLIVKLLAAPE